MKFTEGQQAKYDALVKSGLSYKEAQQKIFDEEVPENASPDGVDPSPEDDAKVTDTEASG